MADVSIALNRFGLGARPDDPLSEEPRKWLIGQLDAFEPNPPAIAALPGRQPQTGMPPSAAASWESCLRLCIWEHHRGARERVPAFTVL